VFSNNEPGTARFDPEQEGQCAEIAIGDQQIILRQQRQHLIQQTAFLRVSILTQHDLIDQHPLGIEQNQGLPCQCACLRALSFLLCDIP
jgi:hypothetical protein